MKQHLYCGVCGYSFVVRDDEELEDDLECPQCGWDLTDDLNDSRNDA